MGTVCLGKIEMWEQEKLVANVPYRALVNKWQQDGGFKGLPVVSGIKDLHPSPHTSRCD